MSWIILNKKCFLANTMSQMTSLFKNTIKLLSFFHLNISSLPFHYGEFSTLLAEYNLNFDFAGISKKK